MAVKRSNGSGNVVTIDPTLAYERMLHFNEKHSGWHIFRALYWGIYVFVLGLILLADVPALVSIPSFFGWTLVLGAIFFIVYGFVTSLHLKLMKRHA